MPTCTPKTWIGATCDVSSQSPLYCSDTCRRDCSRSLTFVRQRRRPQPDAELILESLCNLHPRMLHVTLDERRWISRGSSDSLHRASGLCPRDATLAGESDISGIVECICRPVSRTVMMAATAVTNGMSLLVPRLLVIPDTQGGPYRPYPLYLTSPTAARAMDNLCFGGIISAALTRCRCRTNVGCEGETIPPITCIWRRGAGIKRD